MKKPKWENEKELGAAVVAHLREQGWTVYPEIYDIDIVATKPDVNSPRGLKVIGVECKKHFNITVLAQAHRKQKYVDEIWVAVGKGHDNHEWYGRMVAAQNGYGVIIVEKLPAIKVAGFTSPATYKVRIDETAKVDPRRLFYVDALLDPEAENYAEAGQAGGRQWSKFKRTVMLMSDYVKNNPGCSMKEVVAAIKHHYSNPTSARACLAGRIRDGVIKEVVFTDGKLFVVVPQENLVESPKTDVIVNGEKNEEKTCPC